MADVGVWVDSFRCLDAVERLREAIGESGGVGAGSVGDAASDDLLHVLAALVDMSRQGVAATLAAVADDAVVTVLDVLAADQ